MIEKIFVRDLLENTPRPHYLKGEGQVEQLSENSYLFRGTVNFDSFESPSVKDRKALDWSHVNLGDCAFAFWNAAHILAFYGGAKNRILRKKVSFDIGNKLIAPDKDLDLELYANLEKEFSLKGENYVKGVLSGKISEKNIKLISVLAPFIYQKFKF